MNYKALKFSIKNKIGYLVLAAPPKNEMDMVFFQEFSHLIKHIKTLSGLRGLIISPEGRHFSSGANTEQLLALFKKEDKIIPSEIEKNCVAFKELSELPYPVIACVKSVCFGSALELALCAHFRIAAPNALLSLPETGFGIIPGLGGIYNSKKCIGTAKTLEFVLTGETISGEEAIKSGLIDILANKNELNTKAEELIDLIAKDYKKEYKQKYLRIMENAEC